MIDPSHIKLWESDRLLYHHTRDPQSLAANGFDPTYANGDYFGSFFFASARATVSNCSVDVNEPLRLVDHDVAHAQFANPYDITWIDQDRMYLEGIDGSFVDIDDACTELDAGGWALQIVVFAASLPKLGLITLFGDELDSLSR